MKKGFDIRMPSPLFEAGATLQQLRTYAAIRAIQGTDGRTCTKTLKEIGRKLERADSGRPLIGKAAVSRAISWLQGEGFLVEVEGGYRATIPTDEGLEDAHRPGRIYPPPEAADSPDEEDESVAESTTDVAESTTDLLSDRQQMLLNRQRRRCQINNESLLNRQQTVVESTTPLSLYVARSTSSQVTSQVYKPSTSVDSEERVHTAPPFWPAWLEEWITSGEWRRKFQQGDWRRVFAEAGFEHLDEAGVLPPAVKRKADRDRGALIDDWADVFRLLHEQDNYSREAIQRTMSWLFEPGNDWIEGGMIASLGALRRKTRSGDRTKFDAMFHQAKQAHAKRKRDNERDPSADHDRNEALADVALDL